MKGRGATENLSIGGCLLRTTTPLEVDAHLTMELSLPQESVPIKMRLAGIAPIGLPLLFMMVWAIVLVRLLVSYGTH
jgi:hypothetical protein